MQNHFYPSNTNIVVTLQTALLCWLLMQAIRMKHIWCYYAAHFLWALRPVATTSLQKWLISKIEYWSMCI